MSYDYYFFKRKDDKKSFESSLINRIFEIYDKHQDYGLNYRVDQTNMSLDIAEAYVNSKNIIIEAGVGIGKSYGYLIPALLINKFENRPVVIATSSIQLSEQLYNDVKIIADKLKLEINAVVGKGMNNYACRMKALEIYDDEKNKTKYSNLWWLIEKVSEGTIKERSDVLEGISDAKWKTVCVDRCIFEKCPYRHSCSFYMMRYYISDNSSDIDFIIVNQDLLIRDLIRKNETGKGFIVSNPSLLIIDEAHNFEEKVRSALTDIFSEKDIDSLLNTVLRIFALRYYDQEIEENIKTLIEINRKLFIDIEEQVKKMSIKNDSSLERYKIEMPESIDYKKWDNIISNIIVSVSVYESGKREREVDDALEKLNALKRICNILSGKEKNYLIWAIKSENGEVSICACPKQIQSILKQNLFNQRFSVVLTSATLSQEGETIEKKYEYIVNSLGYIGELSEPKYSPYDYDNHGLLYIANDTPHYNTDNREEYLDAVLKKIIELCDIVNGRTLVLFTAKEDLKYVTNKISSIQTNWEKIIQIEGSSQEQTIKKFIETHGVLFGTGIFWEGINIVGQDLSQVIIVRLPFPVPNDPIIEYKTSISKNPFQEVLLPEMLIRLRQGVGRLIRSENDKGIISILDSRLSEKYEKHYREAVLKSLPFKNVTESIDKVKSFVEALMI
jgi:ATP-dependent DNA helicase DinG